MQALLYIWNPYHVISQAINYIPGLSWAASKRGQKTLVAGEPESPKLVTEIPGPVSKQRMAELNAIQSMASVQFFADYDKLVETFFKKWANTGLFLFIFVLFKQFYRIKTVDISGIRTRMD